MKKTAVITINYNSSTEIKTYVKQIKEYKIIDKIIIVDNASTDNSLELLEQIKNDKTVIIKSLENLGYAKGNNLGVKNLNDKFDYIIISNSDIAIEENAIESCINFLENNSEVAIAAPRIFVNGKPDKMNTWKERTFFSDIINGTGFLQMLFYPIHIKSLYKNKNFSQNVTEVECISGAFFIIKYDVFKQVDFFDPNTFLFYEEDILCKKVRDLGYKICTINTEKCIHHKSKVIDKAFSAFAKKDMFNESRKYYHNKYNKIKKWKLKIFDILNFLRKIEITIQVAFNKVKKVAQIVGGIYERNYFSWRERN